MKTPITLPAEYGMFSDEGNARVWGIVRRAATAPDGQAAWDYVLIRLRDLALHGGHPEATDTVVREAAYLALHPIFSAN